MRERSGSDAFRADICRRHNERALVASQLHASARTHTGTNASTNTDTSAHASTVTNAGSTSDSVANPAAVTSATASEEHREADR